MGYDGRRRRVSSNRIPGSCQTSLEDGVWWTGQTANVDIEGTMHGQRNQATRLRFHWLGLQDTQAMPWRVEGRWGRLPTSDEEVLLDPQKTDCKLFSEKESMGLKKK